MKKYKVSDDPNAVVKRQNLKFSSWLWPYLIIPSCVAALIALFFFVIVPPLRHRIGYLGVGFWLSAFAIWIVITLACTFLWIFAGRHLLKSDYFLISYKKRDEENIDDVSANGGTQFGTIRDDHFGGENKDQSALTVQYKTVEDNCNDQNSAQTLLQSKLSEQEFSRELEKREHHEKMVHSSQPLSVGQLHVPREPQAPRRVSYAGVMAVEIPPREVLESDGDEQEVEPKHRSPRPPTPRFPRGMRVMSVDKYSAKLKEVSDAEPKESTSSEPLSPTVFQFEEKKIESRVSGEIEHVVIGERSSSSYHVVECEPQIIKENGHHVEHEEKTPNKYHVNGEQKEEMKVDEVDFKRRNFSDEERRIPDYSKRMSMDRNQFLGWNPDEGVLAEADPGSKQRQEMRWRKSLGSWRNTISVSYHDDSKAQEGVDDEVEVDDVF